jgi:hypothetical protein
MGALFGGGKDDGASKIAKRNAEAASIRQLAATAQQQASVDQERSARPNTGRGRGILTFVGKSGVSSLGG